MKLDCLATEQHYLDHILPIWYALPDEYRGELYVRGLPQGIPDPPITLAASVRDTRRARELDRRVVYLAHGAGQSYSGFPEGEDDLFPRATRHDSYPGGRNRDNVVLFLGPNESSATENARFYDVPSLAIGCPKMDPWHAAAPKPFNTPPVVCVSFHWDCMVTQESRSAFRYFLPALSELQQTYSLIGHGHPRAMPELSWWYSQLGIPVVEQFSRVMEQADLYVCDNSSTMFEFASLDRPVLVLNAPFYRRYVNHGGRFWDWAKVGVNCDKPESLLTKVNEALRDSPQAREDREQVLDQVYAYRDGQATLRAVSAIVALLEGRQPRVSIPNNPHLRGEPQFTHA